MSSIRNDYFEYIGLQSGKLTIIDIIKSDNEKYPTAICQCACGNLCEVPLYNLIKPYNPTLSCGCLVQDINHIRKGNQAYQDPYDPNIVHVLMNNCNEEMLCDLSTWVYLQHYTWFRHASSGYAVTNSMPEKHLAYHMLILDCPEGYYRDHINRNRLDNRYCNLRIVTPSQNAMNRTLNSKTGCVGVQERSDRPGHFRAYISIGVKERISKTFPNLEDAVAWRKEMEKKYYNIGEGLSTNKLIEDCGPVYKIDHNMISKLDLDQNTIMHPYPPQFIEKE